MGRKGITFASVKAAYTKIEARGEYPTIDRVRQELGNTGSNTTLSKHLLCIRNGLNENGEVTLINLALRLKDLEQWTRGNEDSIYERIKDNENALNAIGMKQENELPDIWGAINRLKKQVTNLTKQLKLLETQFESICG